MKKVVDLEMETRVGEQERERKREREKVASILNTTRHTYTHVLCTLCTFSIIKYNSN